MIDNIGTGAYTVIDRRAKVTNDDQDASSDDGIEICYFLMLFNVSFGLT